MDTAAVTTTTETITATVTVGDEVLTHTISIAPRGPAGPAGESGLTEAYQSATAPDPSEHPFWYNTANGALYEWDGAWVNVSHEQSPPIDALISKIAVVGDSIINQTSEAPAAPYYISQFLGNGWPAHMRQRCGRRLEIAQNTITGAWDHGISGIKADGFMIGGSGRATFEDALNGDADTILIAVGANDMTVTANATAAANIISLWDEVLAAGKTLVGVAIPPTGTGRPSSDEAAWKTAQIATNALLATAARSRRMLFFDYTPSVDLSGDGYFDSIFRGDYIHPNICGGAYIGEFMAGKVLPFVASTIQYPIPVFESAEWITPNPFAEGAIAANSVPTGWVANIAAFPSAVAGYAMIRNIIARTDGIDGNLLQVITSGITTSDLRLVSPLVIPQVYIDANGTSLTTEDTLKAYFEVEIVSGSFYCIELALTAGGVSQSSGDTLNNGALAVSSEASIMPLGPFELLTPEFVPPSNSSYNLRCHLKAYGNGEIKCRGGIFKV